MDTTQQPDQTQETVEITMPEQTGLPSATPQDAQPQPEATAPGTSEGQEVPGVQETQSNPQPEDAPTQPQTTELSTESPQLPSEPQAPATPSEAAVATSVVMDNIVPIEPQQPTKPEEQSKAPPVPGAGAKCQYCEKKEKYQTLADDYLNKTLAKTGERVAVPWVEELALALKINDNTVVTWANKKKLDAAGEPTDEYEHPEFHETYQTIKMLQKLRLQQRVMGRFNPSGAIFLLKANHGLIETEKKVIAGATNEPLLIEIVNEKPAPEASE